jgi:spore germination protein
MKNRKTWIAPSVLSLLLIASLIWGYNQYRIREQYEVALDNHYQRLFYDVRDHVQKVQVSLSKALLASTRERNVLLFTQIMNDADQARDKLAQMPISHADTVTTEKFLTQAADYSYFIIQKHMEGQEITPEQREAIKSIQLNTTAFNEELNSLSNSMIDDNFLVGMANAGRRNRDNDSSSTNALVTSLANMDREVAKAPELIYDGPFADQMINRKPVGLSGNNVNLEQAKKAAVDFIGSDRIRNIQAFEQGEGVDEMRIPSYTFQVEDKNTRGVLTYVSVSKQGGKVLNITNTRPASERNLTVEEGQQKALDFLKSKGFNNMEPNYNLRYDGTVLYNFVYTQNNVTVYPDLVKVKVALDNGEIVGFDASAYYLNHKARSLNEVTLDQEEARNMIKTNFDIDSTRLTLIPKGENEVQCYEFKGKYNDADYIVYINAETGQEEQILQIIQNENGTLTF